MMQKRAKGDRAKGDCPLLHVFLGKVVKGDSPLLHVCMVRECFVNLRVV